MLSGGDQNVSQTGLMKVEGFSDPDDYVDIESGHDMHVMQLQLARLHINYNYHFPREFL